MGQTFGAKWHLVAIERHRLLKEEQFHMAEFCNVLLLYLEKKTTLHNVINARDVLYAHGNTFDEFHLLLLRLHLPSTLRHTLLM